MGQTLLFFVAHYGVTTTKGHVEVAKFLVSKGLHVNAISLIDQSTPLLEATDQRIVSNENVDLIKFLVAEGADVNAKNKDNATPLHHASFNNNIEAVKLLISKGADVNAKRDFGIEGGSTPLFDAVLNGNIEIVRILVLAGADIYARNGSDGETALDVARDHKNDEVVRYLSSLMRQQPARQQPRWRSRR